MGRVGSTSRTGRPAVPAVTPAGALAAFHLTLLAITLVPVLSVEYLALGDLPNHLARLHVLAHIDDNPALAANYEVVPTLTPYLLVDWLLTPLARIWSVYDVGRGFVALSMALTYAGILALSATLWGRLTAWPAAALPMLYSYAFSWGFLNYGFGVGLMFLSLALWFRLGRHPDWHRALILLALSAGLYLTHMLVFGQFAVIVGTHALSAAWRRGRPRLPELVRGLAPIAPPLVLTLATYAAWSAHDGAEGVRTTIYGGLPDKLLVLLSPTLFSNGWADLAMFLALLGGGLWLAGRRALQLAPAMAVPLVAMAALCIAMPNTLLGVWGVDFRVSPVLAMLLVAATRPKPPAGRPVAAGLIAALVLARAATVWEPLQAGDRAFAEFRDATAEISEGARVIVTLDAARPPLPERAYWHLAQLAVIERGAFVPFLFTGVTQLRPSARNREIDTASGHPLTTEDLLQGLDPAFAARYRNAALDAYHRVYWARWPESFDYLVRINPAPAPATVTGRLGPAKHGSFFEIAKIRR